MKTREEKLKLIERNYYSFLCEYAEKYGDDIYLSDEDRAYTWVEAKRRIEALAYRLKDAGVSKGMFVVVRSVRSADTILIWQALALLGAVCVMADAHFAARDLIAQSGVDIVPDVYLTNEDAGGGLDASGDWVLKDADYRKIADITFDVSEDHSSAEAERMSEENDVRALSLIIFTSGSTGKSKAVMLCQRNVIANSVDGGDLFEEKRGDTSAIILPLHHIFGIACISAATVTGHAIFVPRIPTPEHLLRCIPKYGVSVLYAVPTYFLALADSEDIVKSDLSSMRYGLIAGGPSTPEQMVFIEKAIGCELIPVYGMSEYVGVTTLPFGSPSELRCSGVGTFYPLNEGFILDEEGNEVADGEEGELCVRGPELMMGYYGDEAETRAAIDDEGRLHTGDLGYTDELGIIHISGRKKDIIIRGGENISAGKIERALLSLAGVSHAVAVGVRDEYYGEVPCVAVVAKKGASLAGEELRAALVGKLGKHEIPEKIVVLPEFPLTSTGKPDKQKLKEMFAEWKKA